MSVLAILIGRQRHNCTAAGSKSVCGQWTHGNWMKSYFYSVIFITITMIFDHHQSIERVLLTHRNK